MVRFGITLGMLNPKSWVEAAVTADRVGFESVWFSDHLVAPRRMAGELHPGQGPAMKATTPLYDPVVTAAHIAALAPRVRLGTFVYLLGLRHPFVTARAFATLDVLTGGRVTVGAGAGWLTSEWEAAGVDPSLRGSRLDEAIEVCRRLWTEDEIEHRGRHFAFETVAFEPKPVQRPIPICVGGESPRALRRAAGLGDGWMGMAHDPSSAGARVAALRRLRAEGPRAGHPLEVTVVPRSFSPADLPAWEEAGVDRLIVAPWTGSREAVAGLERFASEVGLMPPS